MSIIEITQNMLHRKPTLWERVGRGNRTYANSFLSAFETKFADAWRNWILQRADVTLLQVFDKSSPLSSHFHILFFEYRMLSISLPRIHGHAKTRKILLVAEALSKTLRLMNDQLFYYFAAK